MAQVFLNYNSQKRSKANPKQTLSTFDTQLKIALGTPEFKPVTVFFYVRMYIFNTQAEYSYFLSDFRR